MPTVIVPPPFQGPTQGVGRVEVPASTVRGAVAEMESRYPGFEDQVLSSNGEPYHYVKIFRNGELVEADQLGAEIGEGDEIELVAAIAGG